jgi:hypothetical protein
VRSSTGAAAETTLTGAMVKPPTRMNPINERFIKFMGKFIRIIAYFDS